MKILYVLPTVPHPTMRGELRHYYFLRELAKSHAITLLALAKTAVSPEASQELKSWTERLVIIDAPSTTRHTVTSDTFASGLQWRMAKRRRFMHTLEELRGSFRRCIQSGGFDLVLCYGVDLYPVFAGFDAAPLVLDLCDATSLRLANRLRFTSWLEWPWRFYRLRQVRSWEQHLCRLTPEVIFISKRDREAVAGCPPSAVIIPNGVDSSYWRARQPRTPRRSVVFTGVMDYPPNVDAGMYLLRELAPRIHATVPDCEFVIAGRNPVEPLRRAAELVRGAVITGAVDDLRPYLDRAAVFVAPLRFASGTQNKILEAMAMSVPVVTTPIAADGLRLDNAADPPVKISEDADRLAAQTVALLNDSRAQEDLGARGRAFVERHFDWSKSADLLDQSCRRAVDRHRAQVSVSRVRHAARTASSPAKESLGAVDTIA